MTFLTETWIVFSRALRLSLRNPVWVFRFEDYEMISHWEHPMDDSPTAPRSEAGAK